MFPAYSVLILETRYPIEHNTRAGRGREGRGGKKKGGQVR